MYVKWFSHPADLAEDLAVFGVREGARYLVLPDEAAARPVLRAVAGAGFRAEPLLAPGEMVLYRLERGAAE